MNAKKYLLRAAYELCCLRPIERITLKEICENAEVSKQTVYRYYRDKYELVNELYRQLTQEHIIDVNAVMTMDDWKQMYLAQFRVFRNHLDVVRHLYSSRETGCTLQYEIESTIRFDRGLLAKKGADLTDPRIQFAIEAKDVGGTYMMRDWILGGMQVEDDEMVERFRCIIPHILVPYYET
ncbi:TetR/AcrR family transcriptional regulator [Veillonella magna]|uniref:TetR/AcrR family transcriptional regulator n=1 Tax=Veillonella magna TaxID=464322 RepID=UPI0023F14FC1|nr:TetR/AcrR family transcriptional regulator [Veillonella magna]MBD8976201.1 TetR/AcrR family transcriptional regulator [Veillonella magna]